MNRFYCEKCNLTFESEKRLKKEYKDYILGNCWKYIDYCPKCQQECSEKVEPKPGKSKANIPFDPGISGCMPGGCETCSKRN
jgi:hypothetical protein